MNGAEHYTEAERLIDLALAGPAEASDALMVAAAQVHATLALAASHATSVQYEDDGDILALIADPGWEAALGFATLPVSS